MTELKRGKHPLVQGNELLLIILILAGLFFFGGIRKDFLSFHNLVSIGQQTATIAITSFAMTAVIVARGIDLSIGSLLAFCGVIAAKCFVSTHSAVIAIVASIVSGAVLGGINGLFVSCVGISPFIATLGMMAFARGAALSFSNATSIPIADPVLLWLGSADIKGVPVGFLMALVFLVLWWLFLSETVVGRSIYAVGGNVGSSKASLISVRAIQTLTYALSGVSAGVGALIAIGRLGSAQPLGGVGLEFSAITAAIIGGTKLSGGEGSVLGTALGALLLGIITTGLSFLQVPQQIIYLITGFLVIFAVLLSQREIFVDLILLVRRSFSRKRSASVLRESQIHELKVVKLGKVFPGVKALDDVTFSIRSGEVVSLAGENGAGKSTLVKCLCGVYWPDEGSLEIDGFPVDLRTKSHERGISVIHQHFSLVPDLTVAENLFLGNEPKLMGMFINRPKMRSRAQELLNSLNIKDIHPDSPLASLTVGQRQIVEIAKSMLSKAWLIVMDEPTSALSNRERDRLYESIRKLLANGCAILYISHRMEEIFSLSTRVVVLRDGRCIGEKTLEELSESELIGMMVGRKIDNVFAWHGVERGKEVVRLVGVSDGKILKEASLSIHEGEIVALAGLMGSGRTELLRTVAGLSRYETGEILVDGERLPSGDLVAASRLGICYIPEDRHLEGIVGTMSVRDNIGLVWMRRHNKANFISMRKMTQLAEGMVGRLGVRPPQTRKKTGELSGGNQQKVVIGKWLATTPRILLLDDPTRGVDVGAKAELHEIIAELKQNGVAILMASSELPEVLGVADRVIVMHEGRVAGFLSRGATEREVMELAFGQRKAI